MASVVSCIILLLLLFAMSAAQTTTTTTNQQVLQNSLRTFRIPQLETSHVAMHRLGNNFAYSFTQNGPVHGYAAGYAIPVMAAAAHLVPMPILLASAGRVAPAAPATTQQTTG